jgi:hypothetical protein
MNRLIGGIAVALLFVACAAGTGGTATGGLPTNNPIDTGALGSAAGDAKAALCDPTSQSSLDGLATQLSNISPNADTSTLQSAIGDAQSNLDQLQVSADQQTLKEAALSALQAVQSGLSNPTTLAETASSASTALTSLDAAVC